MENNAGDKKSKLCDEVKYGVMYFGIGIFFSIMTIGLLLLGGGALPISIILVAAAIALIFFLFSGAALGRAAKIVIEELSPNKEKEEKSSE